MDLKMTRHGKVLMGMMALAMGFGSVGCTTHQRDDSDLYISHRGERYGYVNLYDEPTAAIRRHQRGRTASVEGHSTVLETEIYMLNPQQRDAIEALKRLREERKNAEF